MFLFNSPWINPWAPTDPFLKKKNYMSYGFHAGTNFVEKADFIGNKYGKSMAKICAYAMDFFTCLIVNPTALFYNSTIGPFINAFIRRSNRVAMEGKAYISWKPSSYKPILTLASIALTFFIARKGLNAFLSPAPNFPVHPHTTLPTSLQRSILSPLAKVMNLSSLGSLPDLRNLTKAGLALLTIAISGGIFYEWKTKPQPTIPAFDIDKKVQALCKTYPDFGRQAIALAIEKFKKYSKSNPLAPIDQLDQQIAGLQNFFDKIVCLNFNEALSKYRDQRSKDNHCALLTASYDFMAVSYAISCLTLEDLCEASIMHYVQKTKALTLLEFLMNTKSVVRAHLLMCSGCYHFIRWGYVHTSTRPLPAAYSAPFYSPTEIPTNQQKWNRLYNHFCQRRKELMSDDELAKAGWKPLANWTQEDTKETQESFMRDPGSCSRILQTEQTECKLGTRVLFDNF